MVTKRSWGDLGIKLGVKSGMKVFHHYKSSQTIDLSSFILIVFNFVQIWKLYLKNWKIPLSAALKYYNSGNPLFYLKPWIKYPPTSLHQIPELNLIFPQRNDDDMSEMTHFHVHFDLEIVSDRKPILKILGTLTQKKSKPFQASSHSWQIVSKKGVVEGTKTYPVIRNNSSAYRVPVKKV